MHAKICVCDDTVFVGSFNLSRSGEKNAENVLEIEDEAIADRLGAYRGAGGWGAGAGAPPTGWPHTWTRCAGATARSPSLPVDEVIEGALPVLEPRADR